MSLLALMALASAVALPDRVGSEDRWLWPGDIPKSAFEAGEDGQIVFKAVVNPSGKVELCAVEGSTVAQLDRETFCKRVKQRLAYHPTAGTRSYYVLEENYGFVLPSSWVRNKNGVPAHFVMEVSKLPGSGAKAVSVPVNISVDDKGLLLDCSVPADASSAVLGRLACGQLPVIWTPMSETNAAGQHVPYVRQLNVEFREQAAH
jgi:hypothetical protein